MPVYEYRCTACNHQFELRQKFSDAPADLCPTCGGAVHKMVSASAFSLKGGGWYGDGYGVKADETPKSEAGAAAGTEATADSAPKESAPADTSTANETTASPTTSPAKSNSEMKSAVAEKAEKPASSE